MKRSHPVAVTPGDGVGIEGIGAAGSALKSFMQIDSGLEFESRMADVGEPSFEKFGDPLPKESLELIRSSDAVLFGTVGKSIHRMKRLIRRF
jgi:3-isopropylmalate dehydrogenase